ncbi:hypothetical protein BT69DRAFT_1292475 [Atractiella rhizophila]|nr:hypothetical protein BT69DRAFT_1292475 [Atractiella rhizophila]
MATLTPVRRSSTPNLGASPIDCLIYTKDSPPLPHCVSLLLSTPSHNSSLTSRHSATRSIASQNVQGSSGSPLILSDSGHSVTHIPVKEACLIQSAIPADSKALYTLAARREVLQPQLKKKSDTSAAKKDKRKHRQPETEEDESEEELVAGNKIVYCGQATEGEELDGSVLKIEQDCCPDDSEDKEREWKKQKTESRRSYGSGQPQILDFYKVPKSVPRDPSTSKTFKPVPKKEVDRFFRKTVEWIIWRDHAWTVVEENELEQAIKLKPLMKLYGSATARKWARRLCDALKEQVQKELDELMLGVLNEDCEEATEKPKEKGKGKDKDNSEKKSLENVALACDEEGWSEAESEATHISAK